MTQEQFNAKQRDDTFTALEAMKRGALPPVSGSESLAWFPRCRLAWLERKAKATGHIGRAEIMAAFGISAAHASNDLQAYLALNPCALTYHTSRKRYEWTGEKLAITPAPWGDFPS